MEEHWITEDWKTLTEMLPPQWREKACELGALRRARKVKTPDELLRLLLLHIGPGISLRQAVARAAECGLPDISDVALMGRLRNSEKWLQYISEQLFTQMQSESKPVRLHDGYRCIAVDSTIIKETGPCASDWRLHYAIEVSTLSCTQAELTSIKIGESLTRYKVVLKDIFLGDRNYCKAGQIEYIFSNGGHVVIRWHRTSLPLLTIDGEEVNVIDLLKDLKHGEWAEHEVRMRDSDIPLRLCAVRVSKEAQQRQIESITKSAHKRDAEPTEESLALSPYIVVVTTLPKEKFSAESVMDLYRLRWQIELSFKRLKSLLNVGHVPKFVAASTRAWLQGKLLTCLLMEKLLLNEEVFSP